MKNPLIVDLSQISLDGNHVFPSDEIRGSFPIPSGVTCDENTLSYFPLKFGVDTVTGCELPKSDVVSPPIPLASLFPYYSKLTKVSKFGKANPEDLPNWIEIPHCWTETETFESTGRIYVENLAFFYDQFGRTDHPNYRIISVEKTCPSLAPMANSNQPSRFIFSFSFYAVTNQQVERYLPPFPILLPVLSDDFFFPFSKEWDK